MRRFFVRFFAIVVYITKNGTHIFDEWNGRSEEKKQVTTKLHSMDVHLLVKWNTTKIRNDIISAKL